MSEVLQPHPRTARVLLLSNDKKLRGFLPSLLASEGLTVSLSKPSDGVLAQSRTTRAEVLVLDTFEVSLDTLVRSYRGIVAPRLSGVILLTDMDSDRIHEHELGAIVDIITGRPIHAKRLLACIRGLLGGAQVQAQGLSYSAGDAVVWPVHGKFRLGPKEVEITWTEGQILRELVRNADTVVTRDQITTQALNSDQPKNYRGLGKHIHRIRNKIGPNALGESPIRTIRGIGFMFVSQWDPS